MGKIKALSPLVADQIRAQEVLERPANLLKEVIENALDAKASHLKIAFKENGLDFFEIEDNGEGMDFDDLALAFRRHATSKITDLSDLEKLQTFGFRGEGLASIASVSSLLCLSRTSSCPNNMAGKVLLEQGQQQEHSRAYKETAGTLLQIRHLFQTTPARFKFLKSKRSEFLGLWHYLCCFLMANPSVSFDIKIEEGPTLFFGPESLEDRFLKICKTEIKALEVKGESQNYSYQGLFSSQGYKSSMGRQRLLLVNGRPLEDKHLHFLLQEYGKKIWGQECWGNYFFSLTVPPDLIDVNRGADKTRIKFSESDFLYSFVAQTLKTQQTEHFNQTQNNNLASLHNRGHGHGHGHDQKTFPSSSDSAFFQNEATPLVTFSQSLALCILEEKQCLRLWNLPLVFKFVWFLEDFFQGELPDYKIVPRLISNPLSLGPISQETLSFLKTRGIVLEKTSSVFLLRGIPPYMQHWPDLSLVFSSLMFLKEKEKQHITSLQEFLELIPNDSLATHLISSSKWQEWQHFVLSSRPWPVELTLPTPFKEIFSETLEQFFL